MGERELEMLIAEVDRRIESIIPDDLGKKVEKPIAAFEDPLVVFDGKACVEICIAPEPVFDDIIEIVEIGETEAVCSNPSSQYTRRLLEAKNAKGLSYCHGQDHKSQKP